MTNTLRTKILLIGLFFMPGLLLISNLASGAPLDVNPNRSHPKSATPDPATEIQGQIDTMIQEAIEREETVLGYWIYDIQIDNFQLSADGTWASARIIFLDPETGKVIPTEPGLVIAERSATGWQVFLPSSPDWSGAVEDAPNDLLSTTTKLSWIQQYELHLESAPAAPFSGYLLPWAAGEDMYLTRSITHGIGGSMHYAFDFAKPGYPSGMWSIYAAKGGTVKYAIWTYPNGYDDGNCNHQNYIVLEHQDSSPVTYSMYIHLAQEALRDC